MPRVSRPTSRTGGWCRASFARTTGRRRRSWKHCSRRSRPRGLEAALEVADGLGLAQQLLVPSRRKVAVRAIEHVGEAGLAKARAQVDGLRTRVAAVPEEGLQLGLELGEAETEE